MVTKEVMFEIIEEREGIEMAQAHQSEKSSEELVNYFERHYKTFESDAPAHEIIEIALDMMGESAFIEMLERNSFSDIFEMLAIEGYLTKIGDLWVVSIDHTWLQEKEIA